MSGTFFGDRDESVTQHWNGCQILSMESADSVFMSANKVEKEAGQRTEENICSFGQCHSSSLHMMF